MKYGLVFLLGLMAGIALAASGQLSRDAMAVVVGVVTGICASIPMAVFMAALVRRQSRQ